MAIERGNQGMGEWGNGGGREREQDIEMEKVIEERGRKRDGGIEREED